MSAASPGRPDGHGLSAATGAAVLVTVVATVLALTGAAWLLQRDGAEGGASPAGPAVTVVAYTLVDTPAGPRLAADVREVLSSGDPAQDALTATLTGAPTDPDHRALVEEPGALEVTTGRGEDGVVRVDVETRGADLGSDEAVFTQAVAWTLATSAGGDDVDVALTVDGSSTGAPFRPRADALAPITIETLGDGETVPTTFTVSGLAAAFEGTVAWRLLDGTEVVDEGFTTAEEGGTPSPYSFEATAPPGAHVLEVGETDPSDGEGFPAYVETRTLTVG